MKEWLFEVYNLRGVTPIRIMPLSAVRVVWGLQFKGGNTSNRKPSLTPGVVLGLQ
jgi:hypothetical protein